MTLLGSRAFHDGGQLAIRGVRTALADVLACVGGDPSQPQELSRRFGLDKTLSWRIARVIREEDAWEAVQHIPRRPSIGIFVDTMARHGASKQMLDVVWRAFEDFDRFVETHSGDRETLEAMVSATSRKSAEKRREVFRKNAFQANSAIWGLRARLHVGSNIMVPTAQPEMLEIATISGFVDLFRLRENVPWTIASAIEWDGPDGTTSSHEDARPIPLHTEGLVDGVPVLPQFSSNPLPNLRAVRAPGSNSRFEIADGPVGGEATATVFLGWKWATQVSTRQSSPDEMGEHGLHFWTPVETAIVDLFIHRSLIFAMQPVVRVYSELPGGPKYPTEGRDIGRLPMPEDVIDLGMGPPDTTTPEIPRYRELMEFAVGRMGFALKDFHGFRYRLSYPPIPAMALLQHPLQPMQGA